MLHQPRSAHNLLLALLSVGMAGLLGELFLLDHYEEPAQFLPLVMLTTGLGMAGVVWRRPSRRVLRAYRQLMTLFVVTGMLGLYFHFRGNLEFALERDPALTGLKLVWKALTGATPALAPGALAQLGLLGLIHAYFHPASRSVHSVMHHAHEEESIK